MRDAVLGLRQLLRLTRNPMLYAAGEGPDGEQANAESLMLYH